MSPYVGTQRTLLTSPDIGAALRRSTLAYWRLAETSGTRVDASGRGSDLTDNNTVTGNPGPSTTLPLATQNAVANLEYLSKADGGAGVDLTRRGNNSWGIHGWVYLDDVTLAVHGLISKEDATNGDYLMAYSFGIPAFTATIYGAGGVTSVNASTFGAASVSTYYFIVSWYDKSAATINISINNGPVNSSAVTVGVSGGATGPFFIGAANSGVANAPYRYHDGRQAGWGLLDRPPTASERTWLWNSGNGRRLF